MATEYHSGIIGHRHGLMVVLFLGCLFMYASRVGLSVAMVAMTIHNTTVSNNNSENLDTCPKDSLARTNSSADANVGCG